jgi:hypothetical protein
MARSALKTSSSTAPRGGDTSSHFKDAILDELAKVANVAQFVSFSPGDEPEVRYTRVSGAAPVLRSLRDAVKAVMDRSVEHSVNVRSFHPQSSKANEFVYGLTNLEAVTSNVRRLARQGLYTIVNETIDVNDGGVSGVSYSGILEFGPGDTPRIVEKAGTASLSLEMGMRILSTVYGFSPELQYPPGVRVEFSIHPLRRGVRQTHTIIWELESTGALELQANPVWPNLFSRHVGDKVFGLLVADAIGLPVPQTTVICRNIATFRFGRPAGTGERWIRTSPAVQTPGKFTTRRGWIDPFKLISSEDSHDELIASVLDQEGVDARYSGAAVPGPSGELTVEGVAGFGDAFMVGEAGPQELPGSVLRKVGAVYDMASRRLGPVRFEWVMDERRVWIVQLHRGTTMTSGGKIYPGNPKTWREFHVESGLDALRALIDALPHGEEVGVVLIGQVGVTSHFGDLLRRARIPSRLK